MSDDAGIPSFSLSRVVRLRGSALEALAGFVGKKCDSTTLEGVCLSLLGACFPKSKEVRDAVFPALKITAYSVSQGGAFTEQMRRLLAAKVAGNDLSLRLGLPVLRWSGAGLSEWFLAWVQNCDVRRGRERSRPGAYLFFQVLTGAASGGIIRQYFSREVIARMASVIGVKKRWDDRDVHPGELCGTYLVCRMGDMAPADISEYAPPSPSVCADNSRLTHSRRDGRECPFKFSHPCHVCWVGLSECPIACHKFTYETRPCNCPHGEGRHGGKVDPEKVDYPFFCCETCPMRSRPSS